MLPRIFVFLMALLLAPHNALALAGAWQSDSDAKIRLIAGVDGVGQERTIPLGIEVDMAEGWHTYWRSPGMAGLPPQVDWTASANLQSAGLLFPAPRRYAAYGLETIGYRGHVIFPVDAVVKTPGQPLDIDAQLTLLLCSSVCVPKNVHLQLTIPAGPATPGAEAPALQAFRAQVPQATDAAGLRIEALRNDGRNLIVTVAADRPLSAPDMFVEDRDDIQFAAPIVALQDGDRRATVTLTPAEDLPAGKTLAGMDLTLTIISGGDAVEVPVSVPAAAAPASPPPPLTSPSRGGGPVQSSSEDMSQSWSGEAPPPLRGRLGGGAVTPDRTQMPHLPLAVALVFALVGGFILNLMPCVLPVLSLKILGIAGHGGGEKRRIRRSFLASAAGIVASFLALALMTVALKELGLTIGWGVQFQQPAFLICLILLLGFFAANLWGLVEIPLPRFLADNLGGQAGPYHPHLAGDFAAGALATLLATPCSAPFLGTAVGFALASGPRDIVLIFAALGLGMSLPYLAIAAFPRAAASLPRPGRWMLRLRRVLGCALALTALWLLWVLAAQLTGGVKQDGHWQRFSEDELARDVAAGKTVFVDVTADWCLTCKANKKFTLSQPDIAAKLFGPDVVALQADWTSPDPAIAAFLHTYGRYGIPFNAVFGPGAPQGEVLPELLTHDAVMGALDRAAAANPRK